MTQALFDQAGSCSPPPWSRTATARPRWSRSSAATPTETTTRHHRRQSAGRGRDPARRPGIPAGGRGRFRRASCGSGRPGGDVGVPPTPRRDGRAGDRRLVPHRRRLRDRRERLALLRRPGRRHVHLRRGERLPRRRRADARAVVCGPPGRRGAGRRRAEGIAATGLRRPARRRRRGDRASIKQWALANGPAYQHPRAVWFVDELQLAGTGFAWTRRKNGVVVITTMARRQH